MDRTVLDVFAMDPITLQWVRAELTVAMEWYTRCITGLRLTPASPKSVDAAAVLYQAFPTSTSRWRIDCTCRASRRRNWSLSLNLSAERRGGERRPGPTPKGLTRKPSKTNGRGVSMIGMLSSGRVGTGSVGGHDRR